MRVLFRQLTITIFMLPAVLFLLVGIVLLILAFGEPKVREIMREIGMI